MPKILSLIMSMTTIVYWRGFHQTFTLAKAYFWEFSAGIMLVPLIIQTRFTKRSIWALVYLTFAAIPVFFARDSILAFYGQWNRGLGFDDRFLYVLAAAILIERKIEQRFVEDLIVLIACTYALFGILQWEYGFLPQKWPANSLAGNSNMTGFIYVMCLPFVLRRYVRFTPLIIVGLIMTNCRGAMVACSVVLFLWFVRNTGARILVLAIIILSVPLLRLITDTNRLTNIWHYEKQPRYMLIRETLQMKGSFFGIGEANYRTAFGIVKSKAFEERSPGVLFDGPHSVILEHFICYGAVPTAILLIIVFAIMRNSRRQYRYAMLGWLIVGLVSFETVDTLPLFWLIVGASDVRI